MVPGIGVAGDVLAQDDLVQIFAPAGDSGRDQPGEHHRGPDQQAESDAQAAQLLPVFRDGEEDQDCKERREEPGGALGQGGQARGDEEERIEARPALGVSAHPEPDPQRDEEREEHVDLAETPLPEDLETGGESAGGDPGGSPVEQSLAEQEDQQRRADRRQGGRDAGGDLPHVVPGESEDQPEEKRRFLRVDAAVEPRDCPGAGIPHLAGDLGIARLVRVPEVAPAQAGEEQQSPQQHQEGHLAAAAVGGHYGHGWLVSTGAAAGRR